MPGHLRIINTIIGVGVSKRTSYLQLPQIEELKKIMEQEAWRNPPKGKEDIHYPDFTVADKWLWKVKIGSDIFSNIKSWEEVITEGIRIEKEIVDKTLDKFDENTAREVSDCLGEEDELTKADLIFIFGSRSQSRIEKGVELYKQGWANKILITGGHPIYEKRRPEAEVFGEWAREKGVPDSDLIIEPQAITIADNVRRSLNLMEGRGIKFKKMIIVAPWFGQRRCWAFMMKYIWPECKLIRINSTVNNDGDYAKNKWWKNENGIRVVFNEFVKMRTGVALNTC
jgi:hypothetical protein